VIRSICASSQRSLSPDVATDDGGDVRRRFVDGNCGLVMYERVDDRCDQLGALVLSGTSYNEGHVEEPARLVRVPTPIRIGFCCIAIALVGNVDSSCGHCYPAATRLLICADAGGANGYRVRAWKQELAGFAHASGLQVTVCQVPLDRPGCATPSRLRPPVSRSAGRPADGPGIVRPAWPARARPCCSQLPCLGV